MASSPRHLRGAGDLFRRIIDLSYAAAKQIGAVQAGVVDVKVEVLKIGK